MERETDVNKQPSLQVLKGALRRGAAGGHEKVLVDVESGWLEMQGRIQTASRTNATSRVEQWSAEYGETVVNASVSSSSRPIVRRIAGRVFPAMDAGNYVGGGVFSQGTMRGWGTYGTVVAVALIGIFGIKYLSPGASKAVPVTLKTYSTIAGQRAKVILSDGSHVILGPVTTLRVKQQEDVSIDITGEALFTINQNKKHPFTVTAHGITTRVLGTEFVVRAYDPSKVRVAVRNGKVSVQSPALTVSNAVVVSANEVVSIIPDAVPQVSAITDMATEFMWSEGRLVLRNVPLGDALVRMSRWYGKDFRVADSTLLGLRIETVLPSDYNPSRINDLAKALGAQTIQSGQVVTFHIRQ